MCVYMHSHVHIYMSLSVERDTDILLTSCNPFPLRIGGTRDLILTNKIRPT